jgi:hypothetical protein
MAPPQKASGACSGSYRYLPRRSSAERGMAVWNSTGRFTTLLAVSRLRVAAKRNCIIRSNSEYNHITIHSLARGDSIMIRRLAAVLALALLHSVAIAADGEKPNALTPKEIEEGWILLFDGETTFGWKTEGDVKVDEGQLRLGGEKAASITSTAAFGPCEIALDYYRTGKALFTASRSTHEFMGDKPFLYWAGMKIEVDEVGFAVARWSNVAIGMARAPKEKLTTAAAAPIRFEIEAGQKLSFRSIKLKPTQTKPLFNGKDLAGWKVFDDPKRNQSKWTVTKEGWLNVKNGPGDLQNDGQYSDFLLQLECISNGKALNSGLFFRCIANEYQNGYEAQIQNGYKDNDRTKPADFGTGAIYRRVPARKVVSNDNEWFTMTVLAHGNHIATWVNGYQTVDWTDDRPADNNPRKGSKTGAGHLSLQGHDPTTDLSFRNIRIVELKTEKK